MKKQSSAPHTQPLKVGFDLDGVLLYNPARIMRPIVVAIKRVFIKKRTKTFLVPKTPLQKFIWEIFHLSSLFLAPGFWEIKRLVDEGKIEAYLITARYSFLEKSVKRFMVRVQGDDIFSKWYYNANDEQPHYYKDTLIRKLNLDVFVEDNYDIVSYLNQKNDHLRVYWITNILDSRIEYPHKCNHLKDAIADIKKRF
jgi:hypothetical protein